MTTTSVRSCVRRAGWIAAVAAAVSACGQKGPLILPSDELASTDTQVGAETSDGEERDED